MSLIPVLFSGNTLRGQPIESVTFIWNRPKHIFRVTGTTSTYSQQTLNITKHNEMTPKREQIGGQDGGSPALDRHAGGSEPPMPRKRPIGAAVGSSPSDDAIARRKPAINPTCLLPRFGAKKQRILT